MLRLCWLLLLIATALPARAGELFVFAAASLSDVMKEIAAGFDKQTGEKVVLNFAGSSTLARQIEEGAPADVFISADEAQMDRLARAGLIDGGSRRDLLTNALVLVTRKELTIRSLADLEKIDRLALADPGSVPAGVYARAVLTKAGLWEKLQPKSVPAENVRTALAIVEAGNADAAFVYATDVRSAPGLSVALTIPPSQSPRIVYPVAITAQAAHREQAERFVEFLRSSDCAGAFRRAGFGTDVPAQP